MPEILTFGPVSDEQQTYIPSLKQLAEGWCERRALRALDDFLPGYFALNGLTDGSGHSLKPP